MIGYKLITDPEDGFGPPSLALGTSEDTVLANLLLSCTVVRGSWWFAPWFGLELPTGLKDLAAHEAKVKAAFEEACQWIVDAGLATRIEVVTKRDSTWPTARVLVRVTAYQTDGKPISYERFVGVR